MTYRLKVVLEGAPRSELLPGERNDTRRENNCNVQCTALFWGNTLHIVWVGSKNHSQLPIAYGIKAQCLSVTVKVCSELKWIWDRSPAGHWALLQLGNIQYCHKWLCVHLWLAWNCLEYICGWQESGRNRECAGGRKEDSKKNLQDCAINKVNAKSSLWVLINPTTRGR